MLVSLKGSSIKWSSVLLKGWQWSLEPQTVNPVEIERRKGNQCDWKGLPAPFYGNPAISEGQAGQRVDNSKC